MKAWQKLKAKSDPRSKFSNLSDWKEEAWKKLRLQQDSSPWPVRCSTNWAIWRHTMGGRSIYWVYIFPYSEMMGILYEIIHICTAVLNESEEWSSQQIFQFKRLERRSLKKKSGLQRDSNPWPQRYRCDALPTELWSHTLKPWFFFQASSFQLLKLENLLRWSLFTFIYNRRTNMDYFI